MSETRRIELTRWLQNQGASIIPYPWLGLESVIAGGKSSIQLVGYGSLMSEESARRTLKASTVARSSPVIVVGARRLFSYRMPQSVQNRYGEPSGSRAIAALNAEPGDGKQHFFNGRLFELSSNEIAGLRERERGYDLSPVACVPWDNPAANPRIAYVLACQNSEYEGVQLVDRTLLPNPRYAAMCREAAGSISKGFEQFYMRTTYFGVGLGFRSLADINGEQSNDPLEPK